MLVSRFAFVAATAFAAGCGRSEATGPSSTDTFGGSRTATLVDVNMPGVVYIPNHVDVAAGGTVRFIFSSVAHDVRFNGAPNAPADILVTSNATVSRTFAVAGTFPFLCTLHTNMSGTVVVH